MSIETDPLGHLQPGSPERLARAQQLADAHWQASTPIATPEAMADFRDKLKDSGAYADIGATTTAAQLEIVPLTANAYPDRLSQTVERRQKFSAPGAHIEQDALAARIRRETAEKFHSVQ